MKEFGFSESDFHAIARRAYDLSLQGAYDQASTLLEGLRAVDPLDRHCLLALAGVRLKQRRFDESAELLKGWLAARPEDADPRRLLIEVLLDAGRLAEARAERDRLEASGAPLPAPLRLRFRAAEQRPGAIAGG